MSFLARAPAVETLGVLSRFRVEFYDCLSARADALFELTDAMLCADGPVKSPVELTLAAEHRRGHGAMYAALDKGWLQPARLRRRIVIEVDQAREAVWDSEGGHGLCRASTLSVIPQTAPVKPPGPSFQAQHVRVRNPQSTLHLQVISDVIP
jgi:hypothetical protein